MSRRLLRRATFLFAAALAAACAGTEKAPAPAPEPGPELSRSPRHQEWDEVVHDGRTVRCFVVFPESDRPRPAVIVLHENKGLTDWVRSVADRLGEAGYVAVAPDLLSGTAPNGGGTEGFADEDAATKGIYALPAAQVTADLRAVADHAKTLPGCSGTIAVAGFCWGGGQSFRFATARADLAAAFVFYGPAPEDAASMTAIACPVYGFYAGDDARINATLPGTERNMRAAGKTYEPETYPGAGHAFMRLGEGPSAKPANRAARDAAWERWLGLLRRL